MLRLLIGSCNLTLEQAMGILLVPDPLLWDWRMHKLISFILVLKMPVNSKVSTTVLGGIQKACVLYEICVPVGWCAFTRA